VSVSTNEGTPRGLRLDARFAERNAATNKGARGRRLWSLRPSGV